MILSIDPSIRHLGWATKDGCCWDHGTINIPQGKDLKCTMEYIHDKLYQEAACSDGGWEPKTIIIEYPEFFQASQKGAVAAVNGTTFGLAAIAGFLIGRFPKSEIFLYTPSQWKGQIPKGGMMYRFEKLMGYKAKTDHEAEAVLLLYNHLNKVANK